MSAAALQRVVVRMLHDPALVAAVYADADAALAGEDVTAAERAWLTAPDPRRWRADPMRRYRGLQALLEEFLVAGAYAVRQGGVAAVDAFFSSPAFHRAIQGRAALAPTFAAWLAATFAGPVPAFAALEGAIARSRRAPAPRAGAGPLIATAPWIEAVTVPGGTLAAWQRARASLGQAGPLAAAVDPTHALPAVAVAAEAEGLLVEPGPAIATASPDLVALLERLRAPRPAGEVADLADLGVDADEGAELLDDLVDDGLLWRLPTAGSASNT
ncbi:MAG: hypothetical protein H6706_07040 [Myxococcales bacterium]|nr:hypothetical protein [Myxococcales bacterium]